MIESRQNKQIKNLFKLLTKKHRDKTGTFLVFGDHAISEAKKSDSIENIYTSNANKDGILVSDIIIKELMPVDSPFDIVAVVKKPPVKPYSNKVLLLDELQDPGNLGTLIRSAVGFGFETIIKSPETVDFYNDKTVRATQGNLFYANLITANLTDTISKLKENGYHISATNLNSTINLSEVKTYDKIAVILGNEGVGIKEEILKLADSFITIPTNDIESLNVSVAGSIVMYELRDIK